MGRKQPGFTIEPVAEIAAPDRTPTSTGLGRPPKECEWKQDKPGKGAPEDRHVDPLDKSLLMEGAEKRQKTRWLIGQMKG